MKIFSFYRSTVQRSIQGMTLVEIIVVLGLFSSIATIALGVLFNVQSLNARLQKTQAILDNANLSVQTITRDIRYGTDFYCGATIATGTPLVRKNCTRQTGGGAVVFFKPTNATHENDRVAYFLSEGVLYKEERLFGVATTTLQMTSPDVFIETLMFYVDGANTSDGTLDEGGAFDYKQPLISLFISGKTNAVSAKEEPVTFNIQTHVSPRTPDNR
jgi:prepilin-type N-terminal cleavage/methylation domain-containing protein